MPPLYPHDVLVRWAVQHGGYFNDDVEIVLTPEKGYHVVVRRNAELQSKTRIAACPVPCTLSILNVIDAEGGFTCRGIKIPSAFIDRQPREAVERFFLMEHYLVGKKSWWAPYIAILPTPDEVSKLQFTKHEDLAWIEGTNLATAFTKQEEQWKNYYERGMEQLIKLNWQNAKSGRLTWELFRWASMIFTSRAFTSQVLSDTLPADRARPMGRFSKSTTKHLREGCGSEHSDFEHLTKLFSEGFPVLVPVLDILNFRPLAQVEWQARFGHVGLEVLESVQAGEEVCNNYGPRDNETLLLGYGFTITDNPFDHFSVALRLPPELSLAEVRPAVANGPSCPKGTIVSREPELKCYIFRPEHPRARDSKAFETALFSLDLLDGISALRATDREWQAMYNFRKTYFAEGLQEGRFEDFRNMLTTMSQLLIECQARLTTLRNCGPSGQVPRNLKQIFAHIYRESQMDILQLAICVCHFVLRRAIGGTLENDNDLSQDICTKLGLSAKQSSRLQSLRLQHKFFSEPNELFIFQRMLDEVPENLASLIRYVLSELDKERRLRTSGTDGDLSLSQQAKLGFCVIIPALLSNRKTISRRFQSWLDRLTKWYPPEDPNWHYVPDRSMVALDDAPPPLLLDVLDYCTKLLRTDSCPEAATQWLHSEMIAWGWNVMEEESVTVPCSVLGVNGTEPMFLLYVPQLETGEAKGHSCNVTSTTSRGDCNDCNI